MEEIVCQTNARVEVYSVEIKTILSVLKPVHARWLIGLYDYLRNQPDLTKKDLKCLELMKHLLETLNQRTLSSILIQMKINKRHKKTIQVYSIVVQNVLLAISLLFCFEKL